MRFGFVSTRFAGTDGVSLESAKWANVLSRSGHEVFWFCGESDRPPEQTRRVPEAHFEHPRVRALNGALWGREKLAPSALAELDSLRQLLAAELRQFLADFRVEVLIPQNALTIPMHLPLGLALADLIRETGIRTLAHHHDFHWERDRFSGTAARPFLEEAFPPRLPSIRHVVINHAAQRELKSRCGVESTVIPNVMDFSNPPPPPDDYASDLRTAIGLGPGDRLILQPTRIIPRKGIELSIELLARLQDPRNKLVISHDSGDEGHDYLEHLKAAAMKNKVDLRLIGDLIGTERSLSSSGEKRYTLHDLYPAADFVTFPSLYEGFGNALLEAIHFGKPLLVNRYAVFQEDIEPVGLDLILIDGAITSETVAAVQSTLTAPPDPAPNRALANRHFGFEILEERLKHLL